jgi:hypothetical protein
MMQLKIDPSKNQTIKNLLHETFPSLKCFNNKKLCVMNPNIVAYFHALIINCITIPFKATINSLAHQHEDAMVEVYSKMKPDSFTSQLQTVLTACYKDIMGMGVQGASGCPKAKVVKLKFKDQVDTNAATAADAAAATPATLPVGGVGAEAASCWEDPPPPSGGASKAGAARGGGRRAAGNSGKP